MPRSEAVTRGIRVVVESHYHPERSRPADDQWFFSYYDPYRQRGRRRPSSC